MIQEHQAVSYLTQFGYLKSPDNENRHSFKPSPQDLKAALEALQRLANISVTGQLDDATVRLMRQPRCGNVDVASNHAEWGPLGQRWQKAIITYRFNDWTNQLPRAEQSRVLREAFDKWSAVVPLVFRGVSQGSPADIEIRFATGWHGVHEPFDGQGKVLAHAFPPTDGDIHFDDAETWHADFSSSPSNARGLDRVAVHEIGHAIGLDHTDVKDAVMDPYYPGRNAPRPDDIAGVRERYREHIWVASLYRDVLERRFDDEGLDGHVRDLLKGDSSSYLQARSFCYSPEYSTMLASRLYHLLHNRAPDEEGLNMWADKLTNGMSYRDVVAGFVESEEYLNNNPVPEQFIDSLYRRLFGRPVDAGGLEHYTSQMQGGTSPADVARDLMASDEYGTKIIHEYFRRILRRTYDGDPSYYLAKFKEGMTQTDFLVELVDSAEYKQQVLSWWS